MEVLHQQMKIGGDEKKGARECESIVECGVRLGDRDRCLDEVRRLGTEPTRHQDPQPPGCGR